MNHHEHLSKLIRSTVDGRNQFTLYNFSFCCKKFLRRAVCDYEFANGCNEAYMLRLMKICVSNKNNVNSCHSISCIFVVCLWWSKFHSFFFIFTCINQHYCLPPTSQVLNKLLWRSQISLMSWHSSYTMKIYCVLEFVAFFWTKPMKKSACSNLIMI